MLRAWRTVPGSATGSADCDTISAEPPVGDLLARTVPALAISQPATPRLSIVVLPFANLSNDPEQQYFADGITGDLTTDLSRIPDMLVISRNTAFTYRDKPVDIEADRPRTGCALCARRRGPAVGNPGPRHGPADRCRNRHASVGRAVRWRPRRSVRLARRDYEPDRGCARPRAGRRRSRPAERASGRARLHFARARRTAEAAVA